jgi:vacuolar-type H+-ATPase subunit H
MADESASRVEGIGSATHLMIEALEKASVQLDQTVKSSIEQLSAFNEQLQRNFLSQLAKLAERSAGTVESSIEDIVIRKEDHAERLSELERTEMETVVACARDFRQQIAIRSQQVTDSISKVVEEQMSQLRSLIENPGEHFSDFGDAKIESIGKYGEENKTKIEQAEQESEKRISTQAQKLDEDIQDVLAEGKKKVDENLDKHQKEFEDKITSVIDRLSSLVSMTLKELEDQVKSGTNAVFDYNDNSRKRLTSRVDKWHSEVTTAGDEFKGRLERDRESSEQIHARKLERKVSEVKDEINSIAHEALAKLTASHKLFHSSLKRLEKKYYERLDRLFARFETALAHESKLPTGTSAYRSQTSHELRDLLHARLKARSTEIVKSFKRQVEQFDLEYGRISSSSQETVDAIRATALDGLDKQVRSMNLEAERVLRSFRNELIEVNTELPQIEDAGKAAALAIMAFKSAMLSFGNE